MMMTLHRWQASSSAGSISSSFPITQEPEEPLQRWMLLIEQAQQGSELAFSIILKKSNEWLFPMVRKVHLFAAVLKLPITPDELQHEANVLLYQAILRVRTQHSELNAWHYLKKSTRLGLWNFVKTHSQQALKRKAMAVVQFVEQQPLIKQVNHLEKMLKEQEFQALRNCIHRYFTPEEQGYLEQRYGLNAQTPRAKRELAEEAGITVQAISSREKRLLRKLKHFLQREGILQQG